MRAASTFSLYTPHEAHGSTPGHSSSWPNVIKKQTSPRLDRRRRRTSWPSSINPPHMVWLTRVASCHGVGPFFRDADFVFSCSSPELDDDFRALRRWRCWMPSAMELAFGRPSSRPFLEAAAFDLLQELLILLHRVSCVLLRRSSFLFSSIIRLLQLSSLLPPAP